MPSSDPSALPGRRLSRRAFLRKSAWTSGSVLGVGACLSYFGERNYPHVYHRTVRLPALSPALAGLRICQISDLHRGPLVDEAFLQRAAEYTTSLNPDLIVVTGDFVSDSAHFAQSCARALKLLSAPLGVYGVLGNHDYWTGEVDRVAGEVEDSGVRLLTNRSHRLSYGGAEWWLCGVDDAWAGRPDLAAALSGVPADAFRLLLCHEPDYADTAARRGLPLQLSGHSHGGQCQVPGLGPIVSPEHGRKYPVGLRRVAGTQTQVYTNVGLGVLGVPIRVNCPPEVTLLTLAKA